MKRNEKKIGERRRVLESPKRRRKEKGKEKVVEEASKELTKGQKK